MHGFGQFLYGLAGGLTVVGLIVACFIVAIVLAAVLTGIGRS